MSSKSVASKKDTGLAKQEPARRRRNKVLIDNARRGAAATARRSAGGLGSDAERVHPKKHVRRSAPAADDGSEIGRRVGTTSANVKRAQARPEKKRRDRPIDTAKRGVAADDRRAGYGHTARRNTKLNTRKATWALEDSVQARPSRKSTRRATNRVKPNQLTKKAQRSVQSPEARAYRAAAHAR